MIEALKKILAEVQETERTNTRNAGTDWRARQFFVEFGDELLETLQNDGARSETRGSARIF